MNFNDEPFLISSLKRGNEEAFNFLVDHYNKPLFGYALSLSNDNVIAQDILQNVFLKIWEKRKKINVQKSLLNYLFKSVYNEFLNQYKKNRSKIALEQKYFETLEKIALTTEEKSFEILIIKVKEEIQNLPPKCRNIFILSRKEGLTNIEISEFLNISVKTVEAHITKAFSVLRTRLGDKVETIFFLLLSSPIKFDSLSQQKIKN